MRWFYKKDPVYWNRANVILFCILMEHLVIAIKIIIAKIIPDLPDSVKIDETRR